MISTGASLPPRPPPEFQAKLKSKEPDLHSTSAVGPKSHGSSQIFPPPASGRPIDPCHHRLARAETKSGEPRPDGQPKIRSRRRSSTSSARMKTVRPGSSPPPPEPLESNFSDSAVGPHLEKFGPRGLRKQVRSPEDRTEKEDNWAAIHGEPERSNAERSLPRPFPSPP